MEKRSLRSHVLDLIGSFLYEEKFPNSLHLQEGILNLIDATSSYQEEGEELYPEIFITNDIEAVLRTLPFCKRVEIATKTESVLEFSKALKLCAPLSKDGWVIYISVNNGDMKYGLVSAEISELSPTFRKQSVGELSENGGEYAIAYLEYAGNKSVLLRGSEKSALICLGLSEPDTLIGEALKTVCKATTKNIEYPYKEACVSYFEKLIGNALIKGHGNLIGVVEDEFENIEVLMKSHPDGIYLSEPIDICEFVRQSEEQKTREASTSNRLHSSLCQSMLNHDGVTVFTSKGRLLGYHIFVKPKGSENEEINGGARSRAFEILKLSDVFSCCFYKSQDGNEKIWSKEDGQ